MYRFILLCVILVVVGAAGWFGYREYQARRHVRWDYWAPSVTQTDERFVVGQGTTMLARPEKDTNGPFPDSETIGNPLKVTITPSVVQGRFVSLRFSALVDYEIIFKPPFYARLNKVLEDYASLRARVIEQKRLSYDHQLDSIAFLDASGQQREIRVSLHSSPQRSVVTNGLPQDEGQTIYLRLDLPFPLEQASNFDHTEVTISDGGVIHLRGVLQKLHENN